MEDKLKSVTVVGLGLMGGSWVRGLKASGFRGRIYGLDCKHQVIKEAHEEGWIDNPDYQLDYLYETDLLVLALPLEAYETSLKTFRPYLSPDCIITDLGSCKQVVHQWVRDILGDYALFVGGHPMVGSEKAGLKASSADLYKQAPYLLTGYKEDLRVIHQVKEVIDLLDCQVHITSPEAHDIMVSKTSHLPHISAALLAQLAGQEDHLRDYVGGGFRDTTRIAGANPHMWTQILMTNRDQVLKTLDLYVDHILLFKNMLEGKDTASIFKVLDQAKGVRDQISIKALGA